MPKHKHDWTEVVWRCLGCDMIARKVLNPSDYRKPDYSGVPRQAGVEVYRTKVKG